jgi:hypothetical protein
MPLLPRSISRTGQSVRWKSGAVFDLPDLQNMALGMMAPVALPCARLVRHLHPQRAECCKCRSALCKQRFRNFRLHRLASLRAVHAVPNAVDVLAGRVFLCGRLFSRLCSRLCGRRRRGFTERLPILWFRQCQVLDVMRRSPTPPGQTSRCITPQDRYSANGFVTKTPK